MNRRMQKAMDARKHYAARHRWAARLRAEIRNYPVATTDDRVDAFVCNVLRLDISTERGHTIQLGRGRLYARTRPGDMPELPPTERAREDEFVRTGTYPSAPWPCMNCEHVTHTVELPSGELRVAVSHTRTCAMCRAKGAPDRLPA